MICCLRALAGITWIWRYKAALVCIPFEEKFQEFVFTR